jgi:seryl-tRNA synthetase
MLDLEFIRTNKEAIAKAIADKNMDVDLDKFLSLDKTRRSLSQEIDQMRASQNEFNKKVTSLNDNQKEKSFSDMKVLSNDLKIKMEELKKIETDWQAIYLSLPNIPSEDSPIGTDDSENVEVQMWGEPRKFDFKFKDHIELGQNLDLVDLEKGVRTSGFRGYYLKNEAVMLQMAVIFYALNKMKSKGFDLMITPTILREFALLGSGHFPFGKDDIYQLANTGRDASGNVIGEQLYLGGTSEPSVLAYYSDTVFDEADLPIKTCGFSQCYRNEVGSYGKDAKGLYRIHEFMKVEQVIFCKDDFSESDMWLENLREISQEILKDLLLPHRVVQVCTGDMGAGKRKMYDIETWMPSRDGYGETHSDSNLTDWQPRRLNIKYRTTSGEKRYVHALNNTVIASPRILIAIFENYQNEDGSITVPKVLQPLCGFETIERKK